MIASRPRAQTWVRQYAPLSTLLVGLLIAIVVLPSALNLPQANPQTLLEYAPVPNDKSDTPPPPGSNLSALGLGSSGTQENGPGGGPGAAPSASAPAGPVAVATPGQVQSGKPSTFRCVGNPPRQTEDPLSPPCVAFFNGGNGGSTYQGVTATELRVLIYVDEETVNNQADPSNQYVDLAQPIPANASVTHTRALLALMRYFNARYQTYGRFVHFIVYFSGSSTSVTNYTPEYRRADAAKNFNDVHPAVVITYAWQGQEEAYLDAMAAYGVIDFGSFSGRDSGFFTKYPGHIWGYYPSVEQQAAQFVSYLCTKIVDNPVDFSGNAAAPLGNSNPRKLGVLYSDNPNYPGLTEFAKLVMNGLDACGARYEKRPYEAVGVTYNTDPNDPYSAGAQPTAAQNMATFLRDNITTVIWPQGYETNHMTAASNLKYYPEWILAGDGTIDGYAGEQYQDKTEMSHTWVVSNAVRQGKATDGYCWQAVQEGDPSMPPTTAGVACGEFPFYEDLRQVFTGVQVAGPRFTPTNLDQGYHAIPATPSNDPRTPACYYAAGDYTCIKDAQAMWWDSSKLPPGSGQPGCWRMAQSGRRYPAGQWPPGEPLVQQDMTNDPCNGFSGNYFL